MSMEIMKIYVYRNVNLIVFKRLIYKRTYGGSKINFAIVPVNRNVKVYERYVFLVNTIQFMNTHTFSYI